MLPHGWRKAVMPSNVGRTWPDSDHHLAWITPCCCPARAGPSAPVKAFEQRGESPRQGIVTAL